MEGKKIPQLLFIISLAVLAGLIGFYYWTNSSFESLKYVPMCVMILTLAYILVQILKRFIYKEQNWWDWLYYIGLISMMLGIFFATADTTSTFNIITDLGVCFLFAPMIFDLKNWIQTAKS